MKNDLKIPELLKSDLRKELKHEAPEGLLEGVLQKVNSNKASAVYVPDNQIPFFVTLFAVGGLLYFLLSGSSEQVGEAKSLTFSFQFSTAFWLSVMAVCLVLFVDVLINKKKGKLFF